jgi:hypothetical protein
MVIRAALCPDFRWQDDELNRLLQARVQDLTGRDIFFQQYICGLQLSRLQLLFASSDRHVASAVSAYSPAMAVTLGSKTLALALLCLMAAHGAVEANRMGSSRKLTQVGAMGKSTVPALFSVLRLRPPIKIHVLAS